MWRLIVIGLICYPLEATAQTCCSGGVPVSANLGMPILDQPALQVSLSYDLNVLETLKSGRTTLEDNSRNRLTHTGLLEIGYSFNRRLSADLMFSFVRQERKIRALSGAVDHSITNGVGDATLLVKYLLLDKVGFRVSPGLGVKLPTGASNLARPDGIVLNADLQPGSGSTDLVYWLSISSIKLPDPTMHGFVNLIYSNKGSNQDYLGSQEYKFGNEFQLIGGLSRQMILSTLIFDTGLALRYRSADPDVLDQQILPSTGGRWIFLNPSIAFHPQPTRSWAISVELPLLADITGTQVTPTTRLNFSYYQLIRTKKNEEF